MKKGGSGARSNQIDREDLWHIWKKKAGGLAWGPLTAGILVKRYKRFLADVRLADGTTVVAHCTNTGTMKTCCEPGRPVYLSNQDRPNRKLKYTWEIIEMPGSLVGINTLVPNRLVATAIRAGGIPELAGYEKVMTEVKTSDGRRLDLCLKGDGRPSCFIEIKNCTLVEDGVAYFPDAVTERGREHLIELRRLIDTGARAVIFFLIQRMDSREFRPASLIDPHYSETLRRVLGENVEALAYDVDITLDHIKINRSLPITV